MVKKFNFQGKTILKKNPIGFRLVGFPAAIREADFNLVPNPKLLKSETCS